MATLYKNRNIWYITVSNGNNRLTRSLRTKDKQVAKQLKLNAELELLSQLSGATQPSTDWNDTISWATSSSTQVKTYTGSDSTLIDLNPVGSIIHGDLA